jgi:hypothetical protein
LQRISGLGWSWQVCGGRGRVRGWVGWGQREREKREKIC